jgi:hypothetical protein
LPENATRVAFERNHPSHPQAFMLAEPDLDCRTAPTKRRAAGNVEAGTTLAAAINELIGNILLPALWCRFRESIEALKQEVQRRDMSNTRVLI